MSNKVEEMVEHLSPIENVEPSDYIVPVVEKRVAEAENSEDNPVTMFPLKITNFPWAPSIEGLEFIIDQTRVIEVEGEEPGTMKLEYTYTVTENPNSVDIVGDDRLDEEEKSEENLLLDTFVGKMLENMLHRMINSQEAVEMARQMEEQEKSEQG